MASTYTTNLRFELQGLGENRSSWGSRANNVFLLADEAIAGKADITVPDLAPTYELSHLNGATDESRKMLLLLSGALTADRTIAVQPVSKVYVVHNGTTGGFNVIMKTTTGGNTITLAPNAWKFVFTDGGTIYTNDSMVTFSSSTKRWGVTATVDGAGMLEIGRFLDFHNANADPVGSTDYSVRLETGNTTGDLYIVPSIGPQAGLGGKIWNANNDGQLSGLDADLLDGFHAAEIRFIEAPNDGKLYARRVTAGVGVWVEIFNTFQIEPGTGEVILKFAGTTVLRIKSTGLILTKNDIEIFSTSV